MNKNSKKGINIKEIIALVLATILFLTMQIGVFAENEKEVSNKKTPTVKSVDVIFPDIPKMNKNGKTFIVYDITSLRKKVRLENSDLEYTELLNKIKLRAERLTESPDKVLVSKEMTKTVEGKEGIARFMLEDNKTYLIENADKNAEPILLDYVYALPDKQEIYAKPIPVKEEIPLKNSGVNKNILTQILDFISLVLN